MKLSRAARLRDAVGGVLVDQLEARRLLASFEMIPIGNFSAAPGQATRLGDITVFNTYDRRQGQVLWGSDGTAQNTWVIRDLDDQPADAASWFIAGRDNATVLNGIYYFTGVTNAHGRELWRSDGTTEGTWMVADIVEGAGDSEPEGFIALGNELFFSANQKIWKTDGTPEGTQQVRGADPLGFHEPERMAVLDSNVYFTTYPGSAPHFGSNNTGQLWKTDGTPQGTDLVADINGTADDTDSVGPRFNLINVGGTLFFTASDNDHGYELWASDGTPVGTRMVKDLAPGSASSTPTDLVEYRGRLYFSAAGALWKTDGTADGTVRVGDVENPSKLTVVHRTLYFVSDSGGHGRELWRTDGTSAGTKLVKDIRPDVPGESSDSDPDNIISFGGHAFFRANDGEHGFELWHSDGTTGGTEMMVDFSSGSSVAIPLAGSMTNRLLATARSAATDRWSIASVVVPAPTKPPVPRIWRFDDTGISNSDAYTSNALPVFQGEAMPGATVRLYANGVEIGRSIAEGGTYSITPFSPLKPGRYDVRVAAADELGHEGDPSDRLSVKIDTKAPTATLASASLQSVKVQFTDDVSPTLALSEMSLQRLDTGAVIPASKMSLAFDTKTNLATVSFPGLAGGLLPSAQYRLTISAKRIADPAGNKLQRKTGLEFFPAAVAAASGKVLTVTGTSAADEIVVRLRADDSRILQVQLNGVTSQYTLRRYSEIRIDAGGADDVIRFDQADGAVKLNTRIYAGDGSDTIHAAAGRDRIYAGAGNDLIYAGSGGDVVYGEAGNDSIYGESGDDYLVGGLGRDVIFGNRGFDRLAGDSLDDLNTDTQDWVASGEAA